MMGRQESPQEKLFSYHVNLSDRVRRDHPLRKVVTFINFDFIYDEVKGSYGQNGNVSVPPPVILKMMFLLFFYDVRSQNRPMKASADRINALYCRIFSFLHNYSDSRRFSAANYPKMLT